METDSMGQLGGLDMPSTARQRIALESRSFRCSTCVKTNFEIIQACEDLCNESNAAKDDVEVPSDLRMAWRDEVTTQPSSSEQQQQKRLPPGDASPPSSRSPLDQQIQALDPDVEQDPSSNAEPANPSREYERTALGPDGTREPATQNQTQPVAALPPRPPENMVPARQAQGDGVPLWVDRAIVVLVVALIALILKLLSAK